jgi:hypothetical protein
MRVQTYRVIWEIDVEADSPKDAAELARNFQAAPDTIATIYDVRDEVGELSRVDLQENQA